MGVRDAPAFSTNFFQPSASYLAEKLTIVQTERWRNRNQTVTTRLRFNPLVVTENTLEHIARPLIAKVEADLRRQQTALPLVLDPPAKRGEEEECSDVSKRSPRDTALQAEHHVEYLDIGEKRKPNRRYVKDKEDPNPPNTAEITKRVVEGKMTITS